MVIWLVGMSGSGKTTIGSSLYKKIKNKHNDIILLDGDILREVWGDELGYSIEERNLNAHRISHLCKMLDDQNIHVIACVLSIFHEWQDWNRKNFQEYFEIFVNTPIELIKERDHKGIYSKAKKDEINNVVGQDIPFPEPKKPDFVIDNSGSIEDQAEILNNILCRLNIFN